MTKVSPGGRGGPGPAVIPNSLGELVVRMGNAAPPLVLWPLRHILVTANLGDAVNTWNRFLGLPEAGVSNQAVGKHLSWGNDLESARSVIILTDGAAVGVARGVLIAVTTVIHELGHVHDDLARAVKFGFPQSARLSCLNDWPGV